MKHITLTSIGGILAAIMASLCCLGPVLLVLLGIGSMGGLAVFDAYRSYLIGLAGVFLALAFYLAYRKREVHCEDGTCRIESGGKWNKVGVWSATFIAILAIAFPYWGIAPLYSQSSEGVSLDSNEDVTFFKVPMVCNAAPEIGCGSRSKFIMLDLMREKTVKEAWLNRAGTVMAVVWNSGYDRASRNEAIKPIFTRHELQAEVIRGGERQALASSFAGKRGWYMGSDVDALSIEEAGVIADRIITATSKKSRFRNEKDKAALREELKNIFQRRFLSLRSYQELNESTYREIEREVVAAGEKYVGKGNMPGFRHIDDCCDPSPDKADCCTTGEKQY